LGEESPGIVLGPNKLSQLRIERFEAMGFKWLLQMQTVPATASKKVAAAPFASSPSTETQDRTTADSSDPGPEQATYYYLARKLDARGKSTSAEDNTLSFEDRIVELI
jgi:hypothetical protein